MTPERWAYTKDYLATVFGKQDAALAGMQAEAREHGLPDIAVSPDVGQLLRMLVRTTERRLAIEVGTLGGYSAVWIARALRGSGRLITIEANPEYADFAERQFLDLGLSNKVEVRRGLGVQVLEQLADELPPESVDVLFLDALKHEYPAYWRAASGLIKPGGLLIADNALGTSEWWIDSERHPDRVGADTLNRLLAADPDYDAVAVPLREGLLLARKVKDD